MRVVDPGVAHLGSRCRLADTLTPYLAGRTASYADLVAAVRTAVRRRLPDLLGYLDHVTDYLAQYYGLDQTG